MALPLAVVLAGLQAVASLGGNAFADARRAREQNEARKQRRKEQVDAILSARANQSGVDTSVSQLDDADQAYERELRLHNAANPVQNWAPLVQAIGTGAAAIADEASKTPSKPGPMSREPFYQTTVDQLDAEKKQNLLLQMAKKYGSY